MPDHGPMTAIGSQVAGIFGIGGGIDTGDRLVPLFGIHIDKGKQAGVGKGLAGAVAAHPFDTRFNADETCVGVDHAAGVMQFVPNPDRVEEVNPVYSSNNRPVGGHQFGADG